MQLIVGESFLSSTIRGCAIIVTNLNVMMYNFEKVILRKIKWFDFFILLSKRNS